MNIKFPFDTTKPIVGESSIDIDHKIHDVFAFVGEHFFENYPKWAVEVVHFEPLDGEQIFIGAKARQIRKDNGAKIESIFEITAYDPCSEFSFQGVSAPYKHSYLLVANDETTRLTFRFELLDLDIFMRPFEKLIRHAIEDGTENTVENIKNLITAQSSEIK